MLRWGRVQDTYVDTATQTGMVTFHEADAAKRVVGARLPPACDVAAPHVAPNIAHL